jgi:hypothetical protein
LRHLVLSRSVVKRSRGSQRQIIFASSAKRLIDDYEDRIAQAEMAREDAESRRSISEGSVAPLVLPPSFPYRRWRRFPDNVSHSRHQRISSQAFPALPPHPIPNPTICRQMQALGGREHPAWTGCTTLLKLLPSDRVPIPTNSGRENLDHLTPSRYVFIFL